MKTYFRLLAFGKPYSRFLPRYLIFAPLAVIFGLVNFSLLIPLLDVLFKTKKIVATSHPGDFSLNLNYVLDLFKYYFNKTALENGRVDALQFVCVIILISVFLTNVFKYLGQRVLSSMRTHVVKKIRKTLFEKISVLHLGYFSKSHKGSLMSSLTNDVNEIENSVVSSIQVIFREPLVILGYLFLLFRMSFELTLFTLLVLPISGGIISMITKRLRRSAKVVQNILGNLLGIIDETITGTRIIKAFGAEKYVNQKFEKENEAYRKNLKYMWNRRELASPLSEFLGVSVVVGILIYGGTLVLQNNYELSASEFLTYIALYSQILVPVKSISSAITNIQRGLVAGERIFEVIDVPVEITETTNAKSINKFQDKIEFRNVSFSYETEPVLKNINLTIHKGKTVALVGASGAGKSTLGDLLPRFYDPTNGEILIDGRNIAGFRVKDLRDLMGIVTQESLLFNDTIFNNIAFGMETTDAEHVEEAARIAFAHDFISDMELGYQTNIGDRGSKLSGGQKQRIAIARAVLKNPDILILDEATSALDAESEKWVQAALGKLMENRTALVIAHRLSTIMKADEIIVLQKGEIAERGTHAELIAKDGVYKKLVDLQNLG
jgi:subfamily B ATP-binding cassette protein MsbA